MMNMSRSAESSIVANLRQLTVFLQKLTHISPPEAGFFLWLPVENDENAALKLWTEKGVRVLPGTYLGQVANEQNPGSCYVRVALVAPIEETQRGLSIIRDCLYK